MKATPAMHHFFRVVALAVSSAALLSSGCATIANGRYQRVQVETNPPAAKVFVSGIQRQTKAAPLQFESPGEVVLHRKEKHVTLRIEKEGYEPAEILLQRKGSQWTPIGGASFLGLGVMMGLLEGGAAVALGLGAANLGISVGIDLATGSAYGLDPSRVSLTLRPSSAPSDKGEQITPEQSGSRK
jgi:hypothetical protein